MARDWDKRLWCCTALVMFILICVCAGASPPATNVILFIGDGMGFEQVKAGCYFKGTNLVFETWPHTGDMTTHSANAAITDSGASGTAMATGHKANNGVIGVALPGDGHEYETVLEYFKARGKRVGLVTSTAMTHATPACFGAHASSRTKHANIAADYLQRSRPHVFLGGGGNALSVSDATSAGYTVATNRPALLTAVSNDVAMLSGQFGTGHMPYEYDGLGALPHLHEMTSAALTLLASATNGFFLMVEGGRIDHAGHANDIARLVREVVAFDDAVDAAMQWSSNRTDTLLIVTADHETGGLNVLTNNGAGVEPTVTWSTEGHTAQNVGYYAQGPGSAALSNTVDNTDIYRAVMYAQPIDEGPRGLSADAAGNVRTSWYAEIGCVCTLEATDSLINTNWRPLATVTADTHVVDITDGDASVFAQRFYRLTMQ